MSVVRTMESSVFGGIGCFVFIVSCFPKEKGGCIGRQCGERKKRENRRCGSAVAFYALDWHSTPWRMPLLSMITSPCRHVLTHACGITSVIYIQADRNEMILGILEGDPVVSFRFVFRFV